MKDCCTMYLKINIIKPVFKDVRYSTGDFPVILIVHTTAAAEERQQKPKFLIYFGQ